MDALLQYKGLILLTGLAALLVLERLFPVARPLGGLMRVGRNLSLAAANAVASWAVVVPLSAFAAQWALQWRPGWLGGGFGLALDLLILDVWIYWWHRANHAVPVLWRFHEVHHLDETLDASSALRFHFGEVILSSVARAAVIFCLGMPIVSVLVFETVLVFNTLFHHSNLRLPIWLEKPLSRLIVTPSIHWVHHHAIRRDTDSNYASGLAVWDVLFGSRSPTQRTADMAIGVEGRKERTLAGLLRRPFDGWFWH